MQNLVYIHPPFPLQYHEPFTTTTAANVSFLHLFQKHSIRVGEGTISLANVGTRVEEVDTEVRIISLHTLRDILDHGDMEGYWQPVDWEDHSLVFSV